MTQAARERYLKNLATGRIFTWTQFLAKRGDMIECDANGTPIDPGHEQKGMAWYQERVAFLETENQNLRDDVVRYKALAERAANTPPLYPQQDIVGPDAVQQGPLPGEPAFRMLLSESEAAAAQAEQDLKEIAATSEEIRQRAALEESRKEERLAKKVDKLGDQLEENLTLVPPPPVDTVDIEAKLTEFGKDKTAISRWAEETYRLRLPKQLALAKMQDMLRNAHAGMIVPEKYRIE